MDTTNAAQLDNEDLLRNIDALERVHQGPNFKSYHEQVRSKHFAEYAKLVIEADRRGLI